MAQDIAMSDAEYRKFSQAGDDYDKIRHQTIWSNRKTSVSKYSKGGLKMSNRIRIIPADGSKSRVRRTTLEKIRAIWS